jgi:mercuric reductase
MSATPIPCCATASASVSSNSASLVVLGGGSAAFAAALKAHAAGWEVTMVVDERLPLGGTCVNVGCVPSKTLLRAAHALHSANTPTFAGISSCARVTSFGELVQQKRQLVETLRKSKYADVADALPRLCLVYGTGRLVDESLLVEVSHTDGRSSTFSADRVVVATGGAPHVPDDIPGLAGVDFLTHETAFELGQVPPSLIVVGARYVGLECAQMFARFGSRVTVLQRSDRILPQEGADVTEELAKHLRAEGLDLHVGVCVRVVRSVGGCIEVDVQLAGEKLATLTATHLLLATGHRPNTAAVAGSGIALDRQGYIAVDEHLQTSLSGVFAAGDVIGDPAFVYTAAYEGSLAAQNAVTQETRMEKREYGPIPWVVFTDPQVAGVGMDERGAERAGLAYDVSVLPMSAVPRCLAARDTRGFLKLVRDSKTDTLLGARVVAHEGAELLGEIALAIKYGTTTTELATLLHPYLTLSEAIRLAAISFHKPVSELSCCASL